MSKSEERFCVWLVGYFAALEREGAPMSKEHVEMVKTRLYQAMRDADDEQKTLDID